MSSSDLIACGLLRNVVRHLQVPVSQAIDIQTRANQNNVSPVRSAWLSLSVNWQQAARHVADAHNVPLLDLSAMEQNTSLPLSGDRLRQLAALDVVPLAIRGGRLWLGMADPGDLLRLQQANTIAGLQCSPVAVPLDALMQSLGTDTRPGEDTGLEDSDDAEAANTYRSGQTGSDDRATVERFLRRHVTQAIERGADTVHIEPHANQYRIRIQPDRQYETLALLPMAVGQMLAETLGSLSQIELELSSEHTVSFHIDMLDTHAGNRLVLRRSLPMPDQPTLTALGFESDKASELSKAVLDRASHPLVLVNCASAAVRQSALHALAHILDQPDEHTIVLTAAAMQGLDGCTQISGLDTHADNAAQLLERVLQHDPTRLMLPLLDEAQSGLARQTLTPWLRMGTGQLLAGVAPDHPWLQSPPVPTVVLQLDPRARHSTWLLLSGRHAQH